MRGLIMDRSELWSLVTQDDLTRGDNSSSRDVSESSMSHFASLIFSIAMVVGPHLGYMFQIHEMYTTRDTEGYSPLVSVILLTSNSVRILYYVGERFALPLLFQSILAVVVHAILLMAVLHIVHTEPISVGVVPEANGNPSYLATAAHGDAETVVAGESAQNALMTWLDSHACRLEKVVLRLSPSTFLRHHVIWTLVGGVAVLLYYAVIGAFWSGAPLVVGYIALGIEALLVVPQILRNHRRRSTAGLTKVLLLTWVAGDVIKLVYFIVEQQPLPFILCGILQICLDVVVVVQAIYYRRADSRMSVAVTSRAVPSLGMPADTTPGGRGALKLDEKL